MSERKPNLALWLAGTVAGAVILGGYVWLYSAIVVPMGSETGKPMLAVYLGDLHWRMTPFGKISHRWRSAFFAPIHAIDRRLRPLVWECHKDYSEIDFGDPSRWERIKRRRLTQVAAEAD